MSDGELETARTRERGRRQRTLRFQDEDKEARRRSMKETKMKQGARLDETTRFVHHYALLIIDVQAIPC